MIVLGVVLEHLCLFLVVKVPHEIVDVKALSPLLAVNEPCSFLIIVFIPLRHGDLHLLCHLYIELPCSQKPKLCTTVRPVDGAGGAL